MDEIKPVAQYKGPVCRGSWALGTACKVCERCLATRPAPAADAADLARRLRESAEHLRDMDAENARRDVELMWAYGRLNDAAAYIEASTRKDGE